MGIAMAPVLEGDFGQFRAPQVRMKLSTHQPLVEAVVNEARRENFPLRSTGRGQTGPELDWGVMVPMYFLRQASPSDIPVVSLSFSSLSYGAHLDFGRILRQAAEAAGVRAALVASGDMSHHLSNDSPYGYNPMGPVFDDAVADAVARWDAAAITGIEPDVIQGAGECGLRSIIILFGALEGLPVASEVLSHEGPFGIGYLVALATVKEAHDGQL
jgi:aromatic ring-opening dioxygenase LigB subunit